MEEAHKHVRNVCLYLQGLHFFIKITDEVFSNCIDPLHFLTMENED